MSHRYRAINARQNGDNGDPELSHLEKALEIGLGDTFPVSDAKLFRLGFVDKSGGKMFHSVQTDSR